MSTDIWKRQAAERALSFVEPGMKLGLGSGSTVAAFVALLADKVKAGLDVACIPASEATRALAQRLGLQFTTLDEEEFLDLTIDGVDEVDGELRLIKGGGGALLREKILAMASDSMIIIADHTKRVATLGAFPLPVEVAAFEHRATRAMIEMMAADAGCQGELRLRLQSNGTPFVTDNGNFIYDCAFGRIEDADSLEDALHLIPGVVETGLFLDLADAAIIAGPAGIEILESEDDEDDGA